MRHLALSLLLCSGLSALAAPAPAAQAEAPRKGPFDPARDSAKDLEAAKVEARSTHRRILLDVGGNWCPWCMRLHAFWDAQKDVKELRDKNYVFVMVNYSKESKNEAFLGQFPKVKGYPHFFVLDENGKVLHSQDTGVLEEEKGYSREKITKFLTDGKF